MRSLAVLALCCSLPLLRANHAQDVEMEVAEGRCIASSREAVQAAAG